MILVLSFLFELKSLLGIDEKLFCSNKFEYSKKNGYAIKCMLFIIYKYKY